LVMTTEVLRNMLLQDVHSLDGVACVVFDEVHFLADPDRGTTWEEAIIYCPRHVQLVCLSATVANAPEIASWISLVHRDAVLVRHDQRAVPLEHLYYVDGTLHLLVDEYGEVKERLRVGGEARYPRPAGIPTSARPRNVPRPRDVVQEAEEAGMLPAIYFIFGRRACETAAEDCAALDLLRDRDARRARRERIDSYLELLEPEDRQLEQVQRLTTLLGRGIAFHHAGLLPILKVLVEELFSAGYIGVVFATETLALGINMPARSVVIAEQTKYDGESRRPLLPNEYAQLTGRAGRRGLDPRGYAITLYSPWFSCPEVIDLITGELLPIRSAFTPRYNTVAALWDGTAAGRERLVRLFGSSLRQFQMNDELKAVAAEVDSLREAATAAHFSCPYDGIPDEAVVQYAALRRQLSEARKRLQRAEESAASARRQAVRPPWAVPTSQVVRREMQRFSGGELVYLSGNRSAGSPDADEGLPEPEPRPGSWGVFLRRHGGGPGLVLQDGRVEHIDRWADVTWLPDGKPAIDLPVPLRDVEGPGVDARALLGPRGWRSLQGAIRRLDLPDLAAQETKRIAAVWEQEQRASQGTAARVAEAGAEVHGLQEQLEAHPCHGCPVRGDHERALRREADALRRQAEAEAEADRLEAAAASQAERTLDSLTAVMHRFDVLTLPPAPVEPDGTPSGGPPGVLQPTERCAVLSRVYDPNGLLLTALAWAGELDHLAPAELMEALSWFCYDREPPRWNRNTVTSRLWELRPRIGETIDAVQSEEARMELAMTSGPNPGFFGPVLAWCRGAIFGDLLERIPLSEGDLLLALNKTLDLATQLREALRSGAPNDLNARALAAKLEVGDRLLRRGIVAQSLRLATGAPAPDGTAESALSSAPGADPQPAPATPAPL
ncbi:MAG TPA: DEAD/DEAH box helicase, partial [Chloroflexota bacterium]|nr:DEAD/DEAH box helicase [Chloroflexota bacterium]